MERPPAVRAVLLSHWSVLLPYLRRRDFGTHRPSQSERNYYLSSSADRGLLCLAAFITCLSNATL